MSSADGYGVQKEGQDKSTIQKKLKLWRLRESELKEEFAERVNNKCEGNEDWCGLKRKLLDVAIKFCGYTKDNPDILKRVGGIKTWIRLCVERESYLGFGSTVGMRKIDRNIVRQKKMLRDLYKWMFIRKLDRPWRRLICVAMVVSFSESPKG